MGRKLLVYVISSLEDQAAGIFEDGLLVDHAVLEILELLELKQ